MRYPKALLHNPHLFRLTCIVLFVIVQAALIVDGGLGLRFFSGSFPGLSIVKTYGRIAALHTFYPFFGPDVKNELFLTLRAKDGDANILERTDAEWSLETRLRLHTGIRLLDLYQADNVLAKMFAADFFARRPGVRSVDVALSVHIPPTMAEYVADKQARENVLYEASFTRDAGAP